MNTLPASFVGFAASLGALIQDPSGALVGTVIGTFVVLLASVGYSAARYRQQQQQNELFQQALAKELANQGKPRQSGIGGPTTTGQGLGN